MNAGYGAHNPSNALSYTYGAAAGGIPETLASIPEDQKAMIVRVISMTPEQLGLLPPQERASVLQLVRGFFLVSSGCR